MSSGSSPTGTSASGLREGPQIDETRGYQTSSMETCVTVKLVVRAGSAVDLNPDITQECAPRQARIPTGRPVSRSAFEATLIAAFRVGSTSTTYGPKPSW